MGTSILNKKTVISASAEETRKFGMNLSKHLKPGDVVCLEGCLGSGKTTLVQGIAAGLGIKGFVRSSSFVIVNEYKSHSVKMYHMDLYRLGDNDISSIGLEEYLYGNGICVIEWADRVKKANLPCSWAIKFTWQGETARKIKVARLR